MSETSSKMLGITVLPEYFQVEGIEPVLDNCQNIAGANAITTSPYVMRLAATGEGQREPPIDAGAGAVRILDRPLWGKRELHVLTSPSFHANKALYSKTCYEPPVGDRFTDQGGEIVAKALRAIKKRGLTSYFQVQAAIPPGYRVQFSGVIDKDQPLLPNGNQVVNRVAKNASLASEDILQYQIALMLDLFQQYPDLDGIRLDWPEYPPYRFDSVFLDFNSQVAAHCESTEFFNNLRHSIAEIYSWVHSSLTNDAISRITDIPSLSGELRKLGYYDVLKEWLHLKRQLVTSYIARIHEAMHNAGFREKRLVPHAFPPPFHRLSGLDYGEVGKYSDHIPVKMYTMHWSMIARFYLDQLTKSNPDINEAELIRMVFALLYISDESSPEKISDVRYPGPDDPQLPTKRVQRHKIEFAQRQAGDTKIAALIHGYGPVDEFRNRFELAFNAADNFAWVNRYCYLSDEKLRVMGEISGGKEL